MPQTPRDLHVLLVDEQPDAWADVLDQAELHASRTTPDAAIELLERVQVDAALVVVATPAQPGLELIGRLATRHERLPVVALARSGVVDEAAAAEAGVTELVELPAHPTELSRRVERAVALAQRASLTGADADRTSEIIGESKVMKGVVELISRVAAGSATILVRGESGTGKELVARGLHRQSERADGPFVKIHCAALPDSLLESEIFGYEKGAFTGAEARKPGLVERAQGGTLLLDEIGDISAATQVKLLRLLQDREFERLGGTRTIAADVRFLAATHRDLEAMVKKGELREDLFYRLNVVPLWVPPLRARHGDVPRLATHFCARFAEANRKPGVSLAPEALEALAEQRWPGNVRELQNVIERLVVLTRSETITGDEVRREMGAFRPFATVAATAAKTGASLASEVIPLEAEVRNAERRALRRALAQADGNRSLAARLLGINRGTLYKKLRDHGLD